MVCPADRSLFQYLICVAVVVEKPFTPTSKEADVLIALAKEKGKLITVYQSRVSFLATYNDLD